MHAALNMAPPEYHRWLWQSDRREWHLTTQLLLAGAAIGTDGSLWIPTDTDKIFPSQAILVSKSDMRFDDNPPMVEMRREYRVPTVWTCVRPVPQTRTYVHTFDGILSTVPSERSKYLWCPSKCPKTLADLERAVSEDMDTRRQFERDVTWWEEGNRG